MRSCAFGPCDKSLGRGGPGCYLCDYITTLQEPSMRPQERRTEPQRGKAPPHERSPLQKPPEGSRKAPRGMFGSLWDLEGDD